MRKLSAFFPILLSMLVLASAKSAPADERILNFHSQIEVQEDGALIVTEEITVRAEGAEIKRGIFRDFPLVRKNWMGIRRRVGFKLLAVLRDQRAESYHTDKKADGIRIYIGKKNRILKRGEYTYTLRYRSTKQLKYQDDYNEVYWNVTGNDWTFPIDSASAVVSLPRASAEGETFSSIEAFTGKRRQRGTNFETQTLNPTQVAFNTRSPMPRGHGLTVRVRFAKDILDPPRGAKESAPLLTLQNVSLGFTLGALVLLVFYYILVWMRVGVDPTRGPILPTNEPPEGFSPQALRYIQRMGYDNQAFAVTLINMASKGFLIIDQEDADYVVKRDWAEESVLSEEEKEVATQLLQYRKELKISKQNRGRLSRATQALKKSLARQYKKKYFTTNGGYLVPGVLLGLAATVASVFGSGLTPGDEAFGGTLFILLWLSIWSVGVVALCYTAAAGWRSGQLKVAIPMMLFALPFIAGELFGLAALFSFASLLTVLVLLTFIGLTIVFYGLLKAPTIEGRQLLDQVEGFSQYLAGEDRSRMMDFASPEEATERFEQFLPFAIALGTADQWTRQFTESIGEALRIPQNHRPHWYHAPAGRGFDLSSMSRSISGSLASAMASSSSSSGGGSSGGGGGGGGGGGW